MVAYLDSSLLLRHILLAEQAAILHAWQCDQVVTSELTVIECRRVIHRYRLSAELDDQGFLTATRRLDRALGGVLVLALSEEVKRRAMGSFPVVIKTLDALHISSAVAYAERYTTVPSMLLFSYDRGMNRAAAVLGLGTPLSASM